MSTGQQLALVGMALADAAASDEWKQRWDAAILFLARSGRDFTADDVRDLAGSPTDHYNAVGARIRAAAIRGLIRKVGYRKSQRPARHANQIAIWRGTDRALTHEDAMARRPHERRG